MFSLKIKTNQGFLVYALQYRYKLLTQNNSFSANILFQNNLLNRSFPHRID